MDSDYKHIIFLVFLTALIYTIIPLILRFILKKRYVNPSKICLTISVILGGIDFILLALNSSSNMIFNLTPPVLYYYINCWILGTPKRMHTYCEVCGKEIIKNENGTCEDCHKVIMRRLEMKNKRSKYEM